MEKSEFRVVFENGVFRPLSNVSLPEHKVLVLVEKSEHLTPMAEEEVDQTAIIAVLSERYSSGEMNLAERHNERSRVGNQ